MKNKNLWTRIRFVHNKTSDKWILVLELQTRTVLSISFEHAWIRIFVPKTACVQRLSTELSLFAIPTRVDFISTIGTLLYRVPFHTLAIVQCFLEL